MKDKKEDLVERLRTLNAYWGYEDLAEFILTRERKIVQRIMEPLEKNILKYPLDKKFPADRVNYPDSKLAILDCLRICKDYL
jgi:hypothetical protein